MKKGTKYWKKRCDKRWSELIRSAGKCAICGASNCKLDTHHLIHRNAVSFRHNLNNGILLCSHCHNFGFGQPTSDGPRISAHGTPWAFEDWMKENRPDQYAWWEKNRYKVVTGIKIDYDQIYEVLNGNV